MPFCTDCGLRETRNTLLNPRSKLCPVCDDESGTGGKRPPVSKNKDDCSLADLKFSDLKNWFEAEVNAGIKKTVKIELSNHR